ncbi:MAG TPA: hypothetical protein VFP84_23025 [Kofleriaceae bacterium]|nr:hypothetical protein [Kofleriaceae bacterium]
MTAIARLLALTARLESEPLALDAVRGEGDALADQLDGEPGPDGPENDAANDAANDVAIDAALRWRIAVVRAVIAAPPDGDAVRELYGELVDRYRAHPARLASLRPLGAEIRRLEADGTLASSLVARSDRRPHRR